MLQDEEAARNRAAAELEAAKLRGSIEALHVKQASLEQARTSRQGVIRLELEQKLLAKEVQLQVRLMRRVRQLEAKCF